jgi:glycine cleavage system P protein (glycine dehydrogenase) subunit 2
VSETRHTGGINEAFAGREAYVPRPEALDPSDPHRPVELLFEKSRPGRRAGRIPRYDLPPPDVPQELRRRRLPGLPEISEPELVRHFTALADRNFGIDTGFYPLGSCTMKHNPRVNERAVGLPGFRDLHPYQDDDGAQGALELMWRLQEILAEVAGLPAVTLQPAAGSQGELTGLMLMRAYFADRGEDTRRDTIITADTAHGTNPASVTMAGYQLEKVATTERGNLDLDDLRAKVGERTAGLMLTNPSTLGLFDEGIEDVARIFHDAGALLYYDGANLNAVVGRSRPGDMGFDIVHFNLHKTFSQPHGGGGPGGGPVAVRERIAPYLPVPQVVRDGDEYRLDSDRPRSIGRVRGFGGPFGVFVRSYAFMRAYGPALREMSEVAVLNANYVLARLKDVYELPYDRLCMHEFVLSARTLKREHGITALDVAKRLMDYGIHPPTIYFPLVVSEALMIEPTETETKERLDAFVDAMHRIAREAADDPELLRNAPHHRPVRRLDEVGAAKHPVVRYAFGDQATVGTSETSG